MLFKTEELFNQTMSNIFHISQYKVPVQTFEMTCRPSIRIPNPVILSSQSEYLCEAIPYR